MSFIAPCRISAYLPPLNLTSYNLYFHKMNRQGTEWQQIAGMKIFLNRRSYSLRGNKELLDSIWQYAMNNGLEKSVATSKFM
jgi:hypothetical protein